MKYSQFVGHDAKCALVYSSGPSPIIPQFGLLSPFFCFHLPICSIIYYFTIGFKFNKFVLPILLLWSLNNHSQTLYFQLHSYFFRSVFSTVPIVNTIIYKYYVILNTLYVYYSAGRICRPLGLILMWAIPEGF